MKEFKIILEDDEVEILTARAGNSQTLDEYLQLKCKGMAEEFRIDFDKKINNDIVEKIKIAKEVPELKADYEKLLVKIQAKIDADAEAKLLEEEKIISEEELVMEK